MALTVAKKGSPYDAYSPLPLRVVPGDKYKARFDKITFDASYPTGGEVYDLSSSFDGTDITVFFAGTPSGYLFEYVAGTTAANGKIKVYTAQGTEVADTTDLSAVVVTVLAVGQSR